MRLPAVLLLLAACRRESGSGPTGRVRVLAGDQPLAAVTVSVHAAGELLAAEETDAVGIATVPVDDDTVITVQFAGHALTTLPPLADTTLEVRTAPAPKPVLVVGVLNVEAPPFAGATSYSLDVGCVTLPVLLSDSIDISACSQGADRTLDVLLVATGPSLAYAAARVPIVAGIADFAVATWNTPTPLPITLDVPATISVTYLADGNAYGTNESQLAFPDLVVDQTRMTATLADGRTDARYLPGQPTNQTFGTDDFLPAVPASLAQSGATVTWSPAGLGDAVVLRSPTGSVVLPPDASSFTIPDGFPPITELTYVDSSELADFDALRAAGISTETAVPPPAFGDVRTTTSQ